MTWHYGGCVRSNTGTPCVSDYDRHIHPADVVIGFDILAALNSGMTAEEALLQFDCTEWRDPSVAEALAVVGEDEG